MKKKWTYERLGDAIDALWPAFEASGWTEEGRQAYRATSLAIFAEAGWTEEEFDIHIEQILDARWAAEEKRVGDRIQAWAETLNRDGFS